MMFLTQMLPTPNTTTALHTAMISLLNKPHPPF